MIATDTPFGFALAKPNIANVHLGLIVAGVASERARQEISHLMRPSRAAWRRASPVVARSCF